MSYLYSITNKLNSKQYYGWTNNYKRRWVEHKCGHGSKLVYQAICKYGLENFRFHLILEDSESLVKDLEVVMIQENCSQAPHGYNLTAGGEGASGWEASDETKLKMSKAHSGENNAMYGKKHSKETREKISQKAIARDPSVYNLPNPMPGASNPRAVRVLVDNVEYGCIGDAAIVIGCKPQTLRARFRRYSKHNNFPNDWGIIPKGDR